jgi:hypothetical protein
VEALAVVEIHVIPLAQFEELEGRFRYVGRKFIAN